MSLDERKKSRPGLKSLREKAEFTQAELAHRVGVAEKAVRNWENDGAIPSFDKAVRLARVLGVSLKRLAQEFDLEVESIPNDSNGGNTK
jgi:transcriptional regulator with XRE-family HTH domain